MKLEVQRSLSVLVLDEVMKSESRRYLFWVWADAQKYWSHGNLIFGDWTMSDNIGVVEVSLYFGFG